jgi:hypothetical protein
VTRVFSRTVLKSGVLWLVPFSVALEVPTYFETQRLLGRDWTTTAQVANQSVPLLMILAAVASCLFTNSWRRHLALVDTLPNRRFVTRVLPATMISVLIAGVHLLYVLLVHLRDATETVGQWGILPFVPVLPAILAFSLIGTLAGTLSTSRLVAPLLGIVLYGLLAVGFGSPLAGLFSIGGAGVELTGLRLDTSFLVAQALWFGFLTINLGLALIAAHEVSADRRPSPLVVGSAAVAILCAMAAAIVVGSRGHNVLEVADVEWVCVGSGPTLCAIKGHEVQMSEAEPRIREVLRRLSDVNEFPVLETYRERLGSSDDGSGSGQLSMRDLREDRDVAFRVIAGSYLCSDNWTNQQVEIASRLADMLAARDLAEQVPVALADRPNLVSAARALDCS